MDERFSPHKTAAETFMVAIAGAIVIALAVAYLAGCTTQKGIRCPAPPDPTHHFIGY